MKKALLILCLFPFLTAFGKDSSLDKLQSQYAHACKEKSDIRGHVPVLRGLAKECSSVIEIGVRSMVSTWGILQGLAENPNDSPSYIGIDIASPPLESLRLAKEITKAKGISFQFWKKNDMQLDIPSTDLLFIDSLHTYAHLTYELETFSSKVSKYIAMHDTSSPWGSTDDDEYKGDYSEYPAYIDRDKRGLWLAVEDFLQRHPEWALHERKLNDHGFTILKRVKN